MHDHHESGRSGGALVVRVATRGYDDTDDAYVPRLRDLSHNGVQKRCGYRKIKRPFLPPAAPAARDSPAPQDSGRTGRGTGACAGRGWPALAGRGLHAGGRGCRLPGGGLIQACSSRRAALIQKRLQRWRRSGGAAAETGAHAGTACTSERRVHTRVGVKHAAKARGTPPWEPWDALGVHAGRRTAFPPHSLAARGATSGSGPDDGCRGRFSDPRGAVRRRTRQRRPGGDGLGRSGVGPPPVSDAEGSSGSPRPA